VFCIEVMRFLIKRNKGKCSSISANSSSIRNRHNLNTIYSVYDKERVEHITSQLPSAHSTEYDANRVRVFFNFISDHLKGDGG
jgi:hypothetical protein